MKKIFILGIILAGCARFTPNLPEKTVYVLPFANRTSEPGIREALTKALVYEIEKYGLRTKRGADYVVEGEIRDYRKEAVSWTDDFVVTEKEIFLSVDITLKKEERVLLQKNITDSVLYTPDLPRKEEKEKERLIKKISGKIARILLKELA
ncbi:MAG: LptE family protein [Candidatus Desantisbacteria bacterium]